jgi:hypothetical protein
MGLKGAESDIVLNKGLNFLPISDIHIFQKEFFTKTCRTQKSKIAKFQAVLNRENISQNILEK